MSGPIERPRNRAERRALRERFRRVDVEHVCDAQVYDALASGIGFRPCGARLVATFIVEMGDPTPVVTFLHKPDGTHEPQLSGTGAAATARRTGVVVNKQTEKVQ